MNINLGTKCVNPVNERLLINLTVRHTVFGIQMVKHLSSIIMVISFVVTITNIQLRKAHCCFLIKCGCAL